MPNWYNRQLPKSRYTFSMEGDIFVAEQEDKALEQKEAEGKIKEFASVRGTRINSYEVEPYSSI